MRWLLVGGEVERGRSGRNVLGICFCGDSWRRGGGGVGFGSFFGAGEMT